MEEQQYFEHSKIVAQSIKQKNKATKLMNYICINTVMKPRMLRLFGQIQVIQRQQIHIFSKSRHKDHGKK